MTEHVKEPWEYTGGIIWHGVPEECFHTAIDADIEGNPVEREVSYVEWHQEKIAECGDEETAREICAAVNAVRQAGIPTEALEGGIIKLMQNDRNGPFRMDEALTKLKGDSR